MAVSKHAACSIACLQVEYDSHNDVVGPRELRDPDGPDQEADIKIEAAV